jgi:hypothetical protein
MQYLLQQWKSLLWAYTAYLCTSCDSQNKPRLIIIGVLVQRNLHWNFRNYFFRDDYLYLSQNVSASSYHGYYEIYEVLHTFFFTIPVFFYGGSSGKCRSLDSKPCTQKQNQVSRCCLSKRNGFFSSLTISSTRHLGETGWSGYTDRRTLLLCVCVYIYIYFNII